MIANGTTKQATTKHAPVKQADVIAFLKSVPQKIKTIHIVVVFALLSVFLGYISVAPPSELPSWPLYRLNSKVWQSFESWGQHVKPYHIRVMTTALQHYESKALYILAYLEVPDFLKKVGKPLSCEEIKKVVDEERGVGPIDLPFLCRFLHAAAHFDLLTESGDDKYFLTPLSEYLTSDHPKSLKNFVRLYSGDEAMVISTALSRSIFSGNSGFKETYRTELLEHLKIDPIFQLTHDQGVADSAQLHAPAIIADYPPFATCKHICDIGGGVGSFLNSVLEYYGFNIKGTNFDLPDVIENAKTIQKASKNIEFVAGNFSEKLPNFKCDCYIIKDVLQEWSDEDATHILHNLHQAMKPESRVLVIEAVLHTGSHSEERFKSLMDLTMMSFNPSHSRLRTKEEFYFLLEQSGFIEPQAYSTRAGYSIIETSPSKKQ